MAVLMLVGCVVGCASSHKKEEVANPLEISLPYEVVWRATVDTIEKDFQIERQDHEGGRIVTRYKEGRTILEPWGMDAQTRYEKLEETVNRVRRRVEAEVTPGEGMSTVAVTVVRERLNYEPPATEYEEGPPATPEEREQAAIAAARTPREQWTFMGSDDLVAQRILREIAERAAALSSGEPAADIEPL